MLDLARELGGDSSTRTTRTSTVTRSPLQDLYDDGTNTLHWPSDEDDSVWGQMPMMAFPGGYPAPYMMPYPAPPYPMTYDDGADWADPIAADDSAQDIPTPEAGPQDQGDNAPEADLLSEYRAQLAEENGEPLDEELAKIVNKLWKKGRDAGKFKEMITKHPKPKNLSCQKVDINPEMLTSLPRAAKTRDARLRSVQGDLARAVVPLAKLAEMAVAKEEISRKRMLELAMDGITILAAGNEITNQLRRDSLKPSLQYKFQTLCKTDEDDTSQWLFGQNLQDRIKAASQGGKLGRNRGYQPFQPYPARGRGRGYYQPFFHPYARGQATRGRSFLGKPTARLIQKVDNQDGFLHKPTNNVEPSFRVHMINDTISDPCRPRATAGSHHRPAEGESGDQAHIEADSSNTREVGECHVKLQDLNLDQWGPEFKAGRVSDCVSKWAKITSDYKILSDIRGYKLEFLEPPTQSRPMPEIKFSPQERQFVQQEIKALLRKGVITKAEHTAGEYISNIFLREKQEVGKFRMILNLKHLNKYIEKKHFKMETFIKTLALITPECWLISFDFSDAYYSCRIFPPHRKYLRFVFADQLYEFTCLPNGLTSAPRFFTKIMKVAHSHLREKHAMTVSGYLDDNIHVNYGSREEALREGAIAAQFFQDLGFTINKAKSVAWPVQEIVHLGFIINSKDMTVTMTREKTGKILELVKQALEAESSTIRQIARLIGKISATGPANQWALYLTKVMEMDKNRALACNKFDYDARMQLSAWAKEDLEWVQSNLGDSTAPVQTPDFDYVIHTDASLEGWGCYDPQTGKKGGGRWTPQEAQLHINALELKAIHFGLKALCPHHKGCHIRIMTDNTTALAGINKQGSVISTACNKIARQIWQFARGEGLWLSAAHCPGVENIEADEASRVFDDKTEWALREDIFREIIVEFGTPTIDLFASRLNHKVPRYCAWQPDPGAEWIDSFTRHWGAEPLWYAFPPFSIIHKVIQKVVREKTRGILVTPLWPTQAWFSLLMKITKGSPITFDVRTNELYLPFSRAKTPQEGMRHPLAGHLTLMAVICDGILLFGKGSQPRS